MSNANQKLDDAIRLLDELDATPLSQINKKLDQISEALVAAKCSLLLQERAEASA